jgi:hypothetical protein
MVKFLNSNSIMCNFMLFQQTLLVLFNGVLSIVLSLYIERSADKVSTTFTNRINELCGESLRMTDHIDFHLFYYFSRNQQEENDSNMDSSSSWNRLPCRINTVEYVVTEIPRKQKGSKGNFPSVPAQTSTAKRFHFEII